MNARTSRASQCVLVCGRASPSTRRRAKTCRSPRRMFGIGDRVNGKACGNCPTNGCLGCPLATEYPEFSKIRARRDRKRRNLIKQRKDEAAERLACWGRGDGARL